jgi:hypothetical protein
MPFPPGDQGPEPLTNSGAHSIIGDKTGIQLGVVVTLVGLAIALTASIVRSESRADWAKERIETLERWKEAKSAADTTEALRLQHIEDSLRRIEDSLRGHR